MSSTAVRQQNRNIDTVGHGIDTCASGSGRVISVGIDRRYRHCTRESSWVVRAQESNIPR